MACEFKFYGKFHLSIQVEKWIFTLFITHWKISVFHILLIAGCFCESLLIKSMSMHDNFTSNDQLQVYSEYM